MKLLDRTIQAYKRADTALESYFAKKDLNATGALLRSAPLVVPFGTVIAPALAATLMPLTLATVGFAVMAGAVGSLFTLGWIAGTIYIGEKQDQRNKLITLTTTNAAGQRVEGSAYDLLRLKEYEQRIASLSAQLDKKDDADVRHSLSTVFERASSYIDRVRVIEASPLAPDATTYTFARKKNALEIVAAPTQK